MFRTLIILLAAAVSLSACAVTESDKPGQLTGKQPFVFNNDASTESYTAKVVFVGTNNDYREAFRRLYNEHGACPHGYEPSLRMEREIINGDWFAENPQTEAELRKHLRDLYSGEEYREMVHKFENYLLYDPNKYYWVRVVYRNRSCTPL